MRNGRHRCWSPWPHFTSFSGLFSATCSGASPVKLRVCFKRREQPRDEARVTLQQWGRAFPHRLLKLFRHFGVRFWGRVPAAGPACRMVAKERRALARAALESCLVPAPKPAPGPARGTLGLGGCHESCPLQGRHPAGLRCSLYGLGHLTVCSVYVGWLMYAFLL